MGIPLAIVSAILALAIIGVFSMRSSMKPLTTEQVREKLEQLVAKIRKSNPELAQAGLSIDIPSSGFHGNFGSDAEPHNLVFHAASVGKLFTTTVIGMLIDEGKLTGETRIASLLLPGTLDGLFIIQGKDYQNEITVEQLLNHTSGIADYFADKTLYGKTVEQLIVLEPNREWSPYDLIEWSRTQQKPIASPGERFHYSDTGYILLGLLIEAIEKANFQVVLHRRIFKPLGMNHTFLPFRTLPDDAKLGSPDDTDIRRQSTLRPVWIDGCDVSTHRSVTADWSGGGVASTAEDLMVFIRAMHSGALVSKNTMNWMQDFRWRFRVGIGYGRGIMELRFHEFSPFLKSFPKMYGHMGVTGIQLFQDPSSGTVICVSAGSTKSMSTSVRLVIIALQICARHKIDSLPEK